MVRRRLIRLAAARFPVTAVVVAFELSAAALLGCSAESEMADTMEIPDTLEVRRAIGDPAARDSMLDTLPGGEMVRGDSSAEMLLLRDKMPEP